MRDPDRKPGVRLVTDHPGTTAPPPAPPAPLTEVIVTLSLSEYEASIITGALDEFHARWSADAGTTSYLRERIERQLPVEWAS